jgi:hypothetical protein
MAKNDGASAVGAKRMLEMAAIFMIGDGVLGLLQPRRHVDLWRSRFAGVDALVRPFADSERSRRLYGLVQVAAGTLLAASLKRRR